MFENYKIKKLLKPRKEFTAQTKTTFLAVFDAAHPGTPRNRFGFLAKGAIAFGALLAILASVSVYADTANVAADSPLYPLKRLDESVQLAVVPASEKVQLQATFAGRRASEIADLKSRAPSSTRIAALSNDLNTALNNSLDDAQSARLGDGQLTNFCKKILPAETLAKHPYWAARFASQCGGEISGEASDGADAVASSSASTTASSSTVHTFFRLRRRGANRSGD